MGGAKFLARFLVVVFLLGIAAIIIVTAVMSRPRPSNEIRISIEQLDGARVRVGFQSDRRRRALAFEASADDTRAARWQIETPGFQITYGDGAAYLAHRDGKPFTDAVFMMSADTIRRPKDYQALAVYGEGGVLLYTGHFQPIAEDGRRLDASFNFTARPDGEIVAFGTRAASLTNWKSPRKHPAFVYFGPLRPVETDHVTALVDPATPQWIVDEFDRLTPRAFEHFETAFGPKLEIGFDGRAAAKPNLFLAAPLGGDQGRLSYAGDALPGQFQITLEGAAWASPSSRGEDIFRRSTLHEAFHLWQSAAAPGYEERAAWIHEGGADAVAVDAMVALGFWEAKDLAAFASVARGDCAAGLEDGSLSRAHEREAFAALYACGYLVADAVARADGATATAFWRDFMAAADGAGGYSDEFFFEFVAARTGDEDFAHALKYFVQTPLADPAWEIDRLIAPYPARAPLAPGKGR